MSGEEKSQDFKDGYQEGYADGIDDGHATGLADAPTGPELPSEDEIARYLVAEKLCPNLMVAETVAKDMARRLFA